jgi:hypothetical protein
MTVSHLITPLRAFFWGEATEAMASWGGLWPELDGEAMKTAFVLFVQRDPKVKT